MYNKRKLIISSTIYKILLEVSYILFAFPNFSYMGLTYEPAVYNLIISYLLFFLLLVFMPNNQSKPSNQVVQLLFLTSIVPFLSFYWLANKSLQYTLYVFFCYLFIFIAIHTIRPIKIPLLRRETNLFPKVAILSLALAILILFLRTIIFGGFDIRSLNFNTIYELRAETQYYGVWLYLIDWVGKLLIPLCIVLFMIEKKRILFTISCLMQIYLYLSTGSKTILFSVVLIVATTYILEKDIWKTGVANLYSALIVFSAGFYWITNNIWPVALVIVRQFAFPAVISFKYYDFFSHNKRLHFSEGLIGKLFGINSPYNIRSAYIISGSIGNHENTGFLSDAYANGGLVAMIIMTCLFLAILLYVDSISRNSKHRFKYTALMVYPIIILNDASLLTTMFTGGLSILLVIMYILASEEKNDPAIRE